MSNATQPITNDQYAILESLSESPGRGLTSRETGTAAGVARGRSLNEALNELLRGRYIRERHDRGHLLPTYYILTERGRREIR